MTNIISIILILSSIGLFFGYVDPRYVKIQDLRAEKLSYEEALTNSAKLQEEKDQLLEKLNSFKETDLNRLAKLLPDNIDNVRLIIDIDNIASEFGMRVRNFKADTPSDQQTLGLQRTPHGTLTLSFSTTGSYDAFVAFMKKLEKSLRIIDVVSVEFTSGENSLYDYSVTIKTYWLK
jgi:Tfp pilus assembly protein PilO